MPVPHDGGDPLVVDAQELRGLARAARGARSDVDFVRSRVAGIMGPLDRRGWNAGAADGSWSGARSGIQNLETDLDQHATSLDARATLVDYFESGQLCGGVPWGVPINDPVNSFSGNLVHTSTDLAMRTRGNLGLRLTRTYNSRDTHVGSFGRGWTSSVEWQVDEAFDGVVFVRGADGRQERHDRAADGSYRPGWGTHTTLSRIGIGWRLTLSDGRWLEFGSEGSLQRFGDRNSNVLSVERDRDDRVVRLADGLGRWLACTYDAVGRLSALVDSAERTVRYGYGPGGQLVTVADPLGAVTGYEYDDHGRLERVVDGLGQVVLSNRYDELGRVVEQVDAVGGVSRFAYDGGSAGRTTLMTDARGSSVSIDHDERGLVSRVVDAAGQETVYRYTACGNRASIRNRTGQLWIFEYDGGCSLVGTIAPDGGRTTLRYDADGNVVARTDQMGGRWSYAYDRRGNLIGITDPSGGRTWAEVGAFGQLVRMTDADGVWTHYRYDDIGNLVETTTAAGSVRYQHDAAGRRVARIDAVGRVSGATYDARDRLLTVTDPLGNVAAVEHDQVGNTERLVYKDGVATTIAYDAARRPRRMTDALGNHVVLEYDANGNRVAFTDPGGYTARSTYDQLDRLVEVVDPKGGVWRRAYDAEGHLIGAVDARGHQATFAHTWRGQIERATDRAGNTTELMYDLAGRVVRVTGPDGQHRRFEYDSSGRLLSEVNPLGGRSRREYTPAGRREAVIDASGRRMTFHYDATGRLDTLTDPTGKQVRLVYDAVGNLVARTDRAGRTTTFTYDDLDRPVAVTDVLGNTTRFTYDATSNLVARQDARGQVTRFEYDAIGRLVGVVDGLGGRTCYEYDPRGPLARHVDANGHVRRYTYDANAWLAEVSDPLGRSTSFLTDPNGNRVHTADHMGGLTSSTFDAEDREIGVAFPGGQSLELTYDAAGRRIAMQDGLGTTRYQYDQLGRLEAVVDPFGGVLGYSHDAHGKRLSMVYPDGSAARYEYDERDRLVRVLDGVGGEHRYEYDEGGWVARAALANGAGWQIDHDPLGRPRQMRHLSAAGVTLAEFAYEYDALGNVVDAAEALDQAAPRRSSYRYDALSRLVAVEDGRGETRFTYDAVGNRLLVSTQSESTEAAEYDAADQLVHIIAADGSPVRITYDGRGNPVERHEAGRHTHFSWDGAGRLTAVQASDGSETTFQYDGDGNLLAERRSRVDGKHHERRLTVDVARALAEVVSVTDGAKTTDLVYGLGRVAARESRSAAQASGSATPAAASASAASDVGAPAATATSAPVSGSGESRYFVPDLRGSVRLVSDANGTAVERHDYDPWGVPGDTASSTSPFGYTGELQDPADGLVYLRARWYEPATGRLLSPDPLPGRLTAPMTQHPYLYAQANPTSRIDPSGLSSSGVGGSPGLGMPWGDFNLTPWVSWLWPPEMPNDPASAVDAFTGFLAADKVKALDKLAANLSDQAVEAWGNGLKYANIGNDLLDIGNTPSSSFLLRLPIVRDLRSLWYARQAEAPLATAESFFTQSKSLEAEATAVENSFQLVRRADKVLPWVGVAIDAGFSGFNQWNEDSRHNVALDTKITDTAVTAAWTAGLSYGGGALFATGCSLTGFGVIVAAGCAALGGYLGGKLAGLTSGWVDARANDLRQGVTEGAQWAGHELNQGATWAGNELTHGADWAGHEVSQGADWAKKHLCPWC